MFKSRLEGFFAIAVLLIIGYLPAAALAAGIVLVFSKILDLDPFNRSLYYIALVPAYAIVFTGFFLLLRLRPAKHQPEGGIVSMGPFKFKLPDYLLVAKSQDGLIQLIGKENRRQGVALATAAVPRAENQSFQKWLQSETSVPEAQISAPMVQDMAGRRVVHALVDGDDYCIVPVKTIEGVTIFVEICFSGYEQQQFLMIKSDLEREWQWLDGLTDEEAISAVDQLILTDQQANRSNYS